MSRSFIVPPLAEHISVPQPLLLPLRKFFRLRRRTPHQVHGKAKAGIQQARTVYRSGLLGDVTLKSSHPIGERGRNVCRASKEIQRVVVPEHRNVVGTGGAGDRYCSVAVQASVIEGPGDRNCVGLHFRYDIGSRYQVLRGKLRSRRRVGETSNASTKRICMTHRS